MSVDSSNSELPTTPPPPPPLRCGCGLTNTPVDKELLIPGTPPPPVTRLTAAATAAPVACADNELEDNDAEDCDGDCCW